MSKRLKIVASGVVADAAWMRGLIRGRGGEPKALLANAMYALRNAPDMKGLLFFDEFRRATHLAARPPWRPFHEPFEPRAWTPLDDVLATEWLQQQGICIRVQETAAAVEAVAQEMCVHPVRTYLGQLHWDGVPRLHRLASDYFGAEESAFASAACARFMIGAVARVFEPGCKNDCMLILHGGQGVGKSTAAKILGGEFFSDEIADLGSKDAAMQAGAAWIIEVSELDAMTRPEAAKTKAFISRREDRFRPPYGRRVIEAPRQCVFIGTTNADGFLRDETGARRFWPVKVGDIDLDILARDRDQLWAEAAHLYRHGEPWWLDTPELIAAAAEAQGEHYCGDPWADAISRYLIGRQDATVSEILQRAICLERNRWGQREQTRVARCLKQEGFERYQRRNGDGAREYRYRRMAKEGPT